MNIQLPDTFADLRPLFDEWFTSYAQLLTDRLTDADKEVAWQGFMAGYAHAMVHAGFQLGARYAKQLKDDEA